MTAKEIKLAAKFLKEASDEYSNHGCNDFEWPGDWTIEERRTFMKEYHDYNGDPEEFDPVGLSKLYIADFAAMQFLAHKLSTMTP